MIWNISLVVKAISSESGTLHGHPQCKRPTSESNDDAVAIASKRRNAVPDKDTGRLPCRHCANTWRRHEGLRSLSWVARQSNSLLPNLGRFDS
jgi:hypothetical protein